MYKYCSVAAAASFSLHYELRLLRDVTLQHMLDSIIADMTSRFSNKEKDVLGLSHLIPSLFLAATSASNTATTAALEAAVAHYTSFLNCTDPTMAVQVVRSEFENWKNYWSDIQHKYPDDLPSTAIDTYLQCDDKFYPRI